MTSIQWTQETWNPVRGCSRISPGCVNCYAERMAARGLPGHKSPTTGEQFAIVTPSGPRWTGKVELIPHMLDVPLRRRKPTTYFVNSMSDLFHEGLSFEDIDRVFAVMALCPQHTFQVLTKRAGRMREHFDSCKYAVNPESCWTRIYHIAGLTALAQSAKWRDWNRELPSACWPLPNVWLGVSVEDQQRADERIPHLLQTPAAVRFISAEPLLGPVGLRFPAGAKGPVSFPFDFDSWGGPRREEWFQMQARATYMARGECLDWVIVGSESGPGARPMDLGWARSIVAQCSAAGVPVFVKQLGAMPHDSKDSKADHFFSHCGHACECCDECPSNEGQIARGDHPLPVKLADKKGGDMSEWPADLRVREMPR